jgi:uncharacterized protein
MPECLVMAKVVGPACNLRCTYCYYVDKPGAGPAMDAALLEQLIVQRLEASPGPVTHFEWHGGEPTLAGLDFFRSVVRIQREKRPRGRKITNGLQTNGVLINDAWAGFLAREGFSVGLSLDGPAAVHDRHRRSVDGEPSHAPAERAYQLLARAGVFVNVLCVLDRDTAAAPDELYDYFRNLGVRYLQFLPLAAGAEAADPLDIGAFLCRVFDRWIREDVGRVVIQAFDEALRPLYGLPHALCIHRETCGDVAVVERDGGFYACDHFVDDGHRIGNIRETPVAVLAADPRMASFGAAKRDTLPRACWECDVLMFCNGGCPKDRGADGLNQLCSGYRAFFTHAKTDLRKLAAHMKTGKPLRAFRA